ncbi:zinc finger protein 862-like [Hydra vulgaris]|uniref:zinc finger protein 862-like n=1 Tax=Hydra vulgaris TaxID=6087 RepID=UPI0032EA681C
MDNILNKNRVTLKTFEKWNLSEVFCIETAVENGISYVVKIFCNVCALYQENILANTKGAIRTVALRYINGIRYVKKDVFRHLQSAVHRNAIRLSNEDLNENKEAKANDKEQQVETNKLDNSSCETKLTEKEKSTNNSYKNLVKIAYEMACHPTMPHAHFSILVDCARITGSNFINRKETGFTGRELIKCCANTVHEKCCKILENCNFFSILSDGSRARKTGKEKELVLVRTERNGIPIYMVTELLEMSQLGGSDSNSVTAGINSVFESDNSFFKISTEDYIKKLVSATADGANVNFGIENGALEKSRKWLLKIYCINHRIELAIKDTFKDVTEFIKIEEFYLSNYYLLRNSGKLKSEVEAAAKAIGITFYILPKISGTRFVGHRKRALSSLLETWPAFLSAYENYASEPKNGKTVGKVKGLLKLFKCQSFLVQVG